MCALARDSLFVNARVHLSGSKGRSAVVSHNVEYIATRQGADRSLTADDQRRLALAERMGIVGYYDRRPGSTALFDADGAVSLREARQRLIEADGAMATLVVSVRREEAESLRLACKVDWERFCRRELAPALAVAMNIPESSVRWLAAEHENAENNKHVHVIAWSSDASFDSLMARNRLEMARSKLTDAALVPVLKAEMADRDLARRSAVDAIRNATAGEVSVELPPDGRISYEHLRRWHPEVARQVIDEVKRLRDSCPDVADGERRFRESVERCADLKGLKEADRQRYIRDAMDELRSRQANALLRVIAPSRTARPPAPGEKRPAPAHGPGTARRLRAHLGAEVTACMRDRDLQNGIMAIREGKTIPASCLSVCPSYSRAARPSPSQATTAVAKVFGHATDWGRDGKTTEEEVGKLVIKLIVRAISAVIGGAPPEPMFNGQGLAPKGQVSRGVSL